MRYAIFSDIHANWQAWEQAWADMVGQQVDVLVCLGDVVGYGPKPEEVLNAIRGVTDNFVMGNHDAAAAGAIDISVFNDHARSAIEWTMGALSVESREFLASVPLAIEAEDILFVHAEICDPGRFGYIEEVEDAHENFFASDHFVTFVGHTHHPCLFELRGDGAIVKHAEGNSQLSDASRYIVNVGSVGEPRNPDDLRGRYVIYDSETREVEFRCLAFDIPAYRVDLESTTLPTKPYFLQVYDHVFGEAAEEVEVASRAFAARIRREAALSAGYSRGPVKLHLPPPGTLPGKPAPESQRRARLLFLRIFMTMGLVVGVGIFILSRLGEEEAVEPTIVFDESPSALISPEEGEPAPPDSPGSSVAAVSTEKTAQAGPELPPTKPKAAPVSKKANPSQPKAAPPAKSRPAPSPPGSKPAAEPKPAAVAKKEPTVVWWRMEPDSAGGELVDSLGNLSLKAQAAGSQIASLAPEVIPAVGLPNAGALSVGAWAESKPSGRFQLRADRSFTLEGWILVDRPRQPVFVAGTRSGPAGDTQGWHIDIRPPSNSHPAGQMCFFYDNGPDIVQALSENVAVANLTPHHFAVVWDHDAFAAAGAMRLYLDGEVIAAARLPHSKIASSQANPFRIGALTNPPRIGLDEVRFSPLALHSSEFLRAEPRLMTSAGSVADASKWPEGGIPRRSQTAVIGPGVAAIADKALPEFGGDLVLREKASLRFVQGGLALVPKAPAKLVMGQGASIVLGSDNSNKGNVSFGPIVLEGNAIIRGGVSTTGHHTTRELVGEISGPHQLILDGVNNNTFVLKSSNSFQGLIMQSIQNQAFRVVAGAPGCLGKGRVVVDANASLRIESADVMADDARLILKGAKDARSDAKVVLKANDTIGELFFGESKQARGTWGAVGTGAEHEHQNFSGEGILTVVQ